MDISDDPRIRSPALTSPYSWLKEDFGIEVESDNHCAW